MPEDENSEERDEERLEERAERQYALFTLAQAAKCGVSRKVVYRRVRRGRYVPEQPGVFSLRRRAGIVGAFGSGGLPGGGRRRSRLASHGGAHLAVARWSRRPH